MSDALYSSGNEEKGDKEHSKKHAGEILDLKLVFSAPKPGKPLELKTFPCEKAVKPAPTDYRPKTDLVKHSGGNPRPLCLGVRKVRGDKAFRGRVPFKGSSYGFLFEGFFQWCL